MCSTHYPLSDLAIKLANIQFEFEQTICDYDQSKRRYALRMCEARGDKKAAAILRPYVEGERPEENYLSALLAGNETCR